MIRAAPANKRKPRRSMASERLRQLNRLKKKYNLSWEIHLSEKGCWVYSYEFRHSLMDSFIRHPGWNSICGASNLGIDCPRSSAIDNLLYAIQSDIKRYNIKPRGVQK